MRLVLRCTPGEDRSVARHSEPSTSSKHCKHHNYPGTHANESMALQHPSKSQDQATTLQDLAHNEVGHGATANGVEEHLNGVEGNVDHLFEEEEEENGALPSLDYLFEDEEEEQENQAYPTAGLPRDQEVDSHQDIDSAALLESLANYEPTPVAVPTAEALSPDHTSIANKDFETLLKAVATAGETETARMQVGGSSASFSQQGTYPFFKRTFDPLNPTKRKQTEEDDYDEDDSEDDSDMLIRAPQKKRKLGPEETEAELAKEREIWGPEGVEEDIVASVSDRPESPGTPAEEKAAGIHSAAALFRRPSIASKKYARKSPKFEFEGLS